MHTNAKPYENYSFVETIQDGIVRYHNIEAKSFAAAKAEAPPEAKPYRITANYIKICKAQGYGCDSIYEFVAGNLGLYGVAFFGHKASIGDRKRLKSAWETILRHYYRGTPEATLYDIN